MTSPNFLELSVGKLLSPRLINATIKKKTGKNSLDFLSDKINHQDENINHFEKEFKQLVERRVRLVQKKIEFKNY